MALATAAVTSCIIKPELKETEQLCNLRNHVEEDTDRQHGCFNEIGDMSYSASFHVLDNNEWLTFWFFLVATSYCLLNKNVRLFRNCRTKPAEKVIGNESVAITEISWCSSCNTVSSKSDTFSEISDLDRTSYMDSLLSLEEEDSEWLSDSMPSTPLSYKCDSSSEVSDFDTPNYWDSLLRLDEEGKGSDRWNSESFPSSSCKGIWGIEALSPVSTTSSLSSDISVDEFSDDEPLFWPFEGNLNWDSDDSWSSFCSSPRKRLVFDSKRSAERVPLECEDEQVLNNDKVFSLTKALFNEDDFGSNKNLLLGGECFDLGQELLPIETLVGLKEFDGHEGLDSEFSGDVFMLDDVSLQ